LKVYVKTGGGIARCNETQVYAGGKEGPGKVTQAGQVSFEESDQASYNEEVERAPWAFVNLDRGAHPTNTNVALQVGGWT